MTARNEAIPEAELDAHDTDHRARRERIATAVLAGMMAYGAAKGAAEPAAIAAVGLIAVDYADALIAALDG